ncbi:MAG TPA: ferritin-like domain-containing protein, partial [Anaerolineales bacterium]|nr:ferritin-like domain-containing protein [Anaerolineales bacterium]
LEAFADVIAERATALGGMVMGTVRAAAGTSSIEEFPGETFESSEVVEALVERVAAYGASARESIERSEELEDMATNDLMIDVARGADKFLYLLEAHLQG